MNSKRWGHRNFSQEVLVSTRMMQALSQVSPTTARAQLSQKKIRALGSLISAISSPANWELNAVRLLSEHPGSSQFLDTLSSLFPLQHGTRDWEGVKFAVFATIGVPDEQLDEGFLYTLVGHMTVASKHMRAIAIRRFRNIWLSELPSEEKAPLVLCPAKNQKTHDVRQVAQVAQV